MNNSFSNTTKSIFSGQALIIYINIPSIKIFTQSLATGIVVNNTKIENKNVVIGSANLYSGFK